MNKRSTLGILACAATAAIAAGNVSSGLYWNGAIDTDGRVNTGSNDLTSGYWYNYSDDNDGGTSRLVFPADVEANTYGNFFGPLIEAYSGIKAHVSLGDGYDYPYAGLGFNIWSENQEGVDISSWGGIVIGYESSLGFNTIISVEDEKSVTGYDNYRARAPKAPSGNQLVLPWSEFKQQGWGTPADLNYVLTRANAIRLQFEGTAGTSGDFRITSIRSIEGTPGTQIVPPDTGVVPPVIPPVIPPVSQFASDTLYWDGSVDMDGRVNTGSDDLTAGYWYEYTDENDAGTSKFIYPSDVEENEYGNFFGPLVEAYGGVKAHVSLGDGYDYPYAGVGFNIWSENQEGVDVTSWGGIVLEYESTSSFTLQIVTDNEKDLGYDNFKVYVPKSTTVREIEFPWSAFKQSGWGEEFDRDSALARIAAVRIQFEGTAGMQADFRITKIRSITSGSGTVVPPTPIVTELVSNSIFWDGAQDDIGRVSTGSDELTSGYWYQETDEDVHGRSKFVWPANVHEDEYGNFFGPLVKAYNGVKGRVKLKNGARHPYASLGFNIWSEEQEGVDVSAWGGLVIEYESTIDFSVELVTDDNKKAPYYGTYVASAPKSRHHVRQLVIPWSKFKRSTGWGLAVNKTSALKHIAAIKFKFEGHAGTVGDFRITKIRSINNGYAVAINKPEAVEVAAVEPVSRPAADAKVILSDRTLSFEGVTSGKAQVVNLRGQVVKSFDVGASADLSNLDAGAYMVRVVGQGVSMTKKIVLK
ncbi:T9SS type A sorting domain-containing protein [Fibrobacter sp. UWR2]|uniref:T9SS type A sorting domain-containing protein n=1 Tax=Fibrobacter sp. UWR2 TaxID=1964352 RepID=UPI001303AA3F|nr:T9SS type A sorting domain-containing protein [Fibrobacter sp. UWR2]